MKPDKWSIDRAIDILDDWLNFNGICPLHRDGEDDADLCTCADEAQVIAVRDWLRKERDDT